MIGQFGGRIIDTAGDGILAEFNSVANADPLETHGRGSFSPSTDCQATA